MRAPTERGAETPYETLMAAWEPVTPPGKDVKLGIDSMSASDRFTALQHALEEPEWSCPPLEQILAHAPERKEPTEVMPRGSVDEPKSAKS